MRKRLFGRTGWQVSEIGFGSWAIGGEWGSVSDQDAEAALHGALDRGVSFIDTADIYGNGRSERLIARVLKARGKGDVIVATKAGRKIQPHVSSGYTPAVLESFIEESLRNLELHALDLVQLHCPPFEVYYRPEIFEALDRQVAAGKLKSYGVSVEKVEQAIKALDYPIASIQIVFNMFRQRPAGLLFDLAKKRNVAVIARVPLASGLLTGKLHANSQFGADDHRQFNRHGEAFDVGETFAGVPFEVGLQAVEALRRIVPPHAGLAQLALRWILMFDAVTTVIPGAKNRDQASQNAAAAELPPLTDEQMAAVRQVYDTYIRRHVHDRW